MSDLAIKVQNLSKLYKIGARQQCYKTLCVQLPFTCSEIETFLPNYALWALMQSNSSLVPSALRAPWTRCAARPVGGNHLTAAAP